MSFVSPVVFRDAIRYRSFQFQYWLCVVSDYGHSVTVRDGHYTCFLALNARMHALLGMTAYIIIIYFPTNAGKIL